MGRNVYGAKCPWGEKSWHQINNGLSPPTAVIGVGPWPHTHWRHVRYAEYTHRWRDGNICYIDFGRGQSEMSTFRSQKARSTGYSLRSTDRPLLTVPRTRTSTAGPLVWNTLPDSVVYCDTFRGFKRKLKTHLTGLAANWKLYWQRLWIYGIMALYKFKYYYY